MSAKNTRYRKRQSGVDVVLNAISVLEDITGLPLSKDMAVRLKLVLSDSAAQPESKLLPANKAARLLGVSGKTLANWRCTGTSGLKHVTVGSRIFYRQADIDAFIRSQIKSSTSQR